MKTVQITISEEVHQRLRYYAWKTRQTMGDAHRQVLEHCLPWLPGQEPGQGVDEEKAPSE